ncbi:MAG TPA: ABC transporter permease [Rhodospirillaceae bacterium]|nr:ABC transporter permease [Rhodospirillaceae bacterium]
MVARRAALVGGFKFSWPSPWTIATLIIAGIFCGPIVAVLATATGDSEGLWQHLFSTVLPRYVANTIVLMLGVGAFSLLFGVTSAWVVVRYAFFGRRIYQWILLLPAAIPGYLIAYTYTDFLEYAGPVQGVLRDFFGWQSARDYWFPEIRSMGGAMLVMGAVLYPYVYVMARTAFLLTPASYFEVGRVSARSLFWSIALPLARPAIVAGLALVLMETISDFGTVEYFAIETLTLGIFNVWLGMNNLTAAAQIATCAFLFIIVLLAVEILARARRRFVDTARRSVSLSPEPVSGWRAIICSVVCLVPVVVGFVVPVGVLLSFVLQGYSVSLTDAVLRAAGNSIFIGSAAAVLVVTTALFMGLVVAFNNNKFVQRITAVASFGYAFPGTVLAVGVVTAGGALDAQIASVLKEYFGLDYSGWFTSGVALIVFACVVRFQAVGYGAVKSGLGRISTSMIEASRVLGQGFGQTMGRVVLPLIRLSCIAGALLVFVDVMKELPMSLLLRPFNFETLATYVYQFAKDELLEEAALPALVIVITGIIPVILMNAALNRVRKA